MLRQWAKGDFTIDGTRLTLRNCDGEAEELSALWSAEEKINAQLNRAYEAFETGVYDVKTFQQRHKALQDQLAAIQEKQHSLRSCIEQVKKSEAVLATLIPRTKQVLEVYDTSDASERNHLLSTIIDHIDYTKPLRGRGHESDFEITMYHKLPQE